MSVACSKPIFARPRFNVLDHIKADPVYYRQLRCDAQLVTEANCPLERPQQELGQGSGFLYR